jgi:predicted Zn-dependent peptidase
MFPLAALAVLLLSGSVMAAGGYEDLKDEVQEFTLDNGVHFIVLERHDVPVFSFNIHMDVGSAQEVTGITGLAHILEHMAFKGTSEVGTEDIKKERKAMAAEDATFEVLKAERNRMLRHGQDIEVLFLGEEALADLGDDAREMIVNGEVSTLGAARALDFEQKQYVTTFDDENRDLVIYSHDFELAKDAAREYVVSNEFGQIVENNGGRGMNAGTWTDDTNYFYSMPSNRIELWAYLEGTRMADPVFREFYTEKDGPVTEERRMRTENSPIGKLIEEFQNLAFKAHPYHHSTIGWMSDINSITRQDCQDFYDTNYVGENMTVAVVGDVEFEQVKKLAEKYFKGISGAKAPRLDTYEPEQNGEKRMVIQDDAQPFYMCGYHIGNYAHEDAAVYSAISDILGQGRTSRLYKRLVKQDNIAVQAVSFSGFPSDKYPTQLAVLGIPAKDVTAAEIETAIFEEIEKIKTDGVTEEELAGVKQRARANYVRGMQGNLGLARQLSFYEGRNGDWREMFTQLDDIEAVTVEDVKRVADEIFVPNHRTVVYIETVED